MTSADDLATGRPAAAPATAAAAAPADPAPPPPRPVPVGPGRPAAAEPRALVPALVFLGMVVAVISSLGAPLIPTIAAANGVSLTDAQWSLTITLLVGAVATPTLGRLGDGPLRRPVMLGAVAVVCTGSVLAALPLGFGPLLIGRGLQGVGLGLTPLAIAAARDALLPARAQSAVALLSITTVAGVGLGYPLTGLIAQSFGVAAGFWFGAAVSAVGLLIAALVLPASPPRPRRPLDGPGAVLLGTALAGLLLALSEGALWGWGSPRTLGLTLGCLGLLAGWARYELHSPAPLIELRLLRDRSVLAADVAALLSGAGMYLLVATITRFVQTPSQAGYGFGSSVAVTGLVLLPFSAASLAASRIGPAMGRRTAPEVVLPAGCIVFLIAMIGFALARGALWEVFLTMAVAGLGIGGVFAALPGMIVRAVAAEETGSAMSVNQVLRYVGYATGSALSATVLQSHTPAGQLLPTGGGYAAVALVGSALWLLTVVLAVLLPGRRSRRAGGRPR